MLTQKFAKPSTEFCDQEIKSVGDRTLDDNTSDNLEFYNIGEGEEEDEENAQNQYEQSQENQDSDSDSGVGTVTFTTHSRSNKEPGYLQTSVVYFGGFLISFSIFLFRIYFSLLELFFSAFLCPKTEFSCNAKKI